MSDVVDILAEHTDYPMYVVTARSESGEYGGCLVGFATKCSIGPPRYLVCISKVNHTFFVAERSKAMVLHLLGSDQVSTATLFGECTGDTIDKFQRCKWRAGVTGVPVLAECAAWVEGVILDHFSVGDHEAFLMKPEAGGRGTHDSQLNVRDLSTLSPGHPTPS